MSASLIRSASLLRLQSFSVIYSVLPYAEKAIPRKAALATEEPANVAAFLLSPRSSGVDAQTIVVDAGMSVNYFDRDIVRTISSGGK